MVDTIVGIDSPNYTPDTADVAANIYCRVTATNTSGSANADSNTVGPVTAAAGGGLPVSVQAAGSDTFTTAAINTTGAGLLIVGGASYGIAAVISDNKGNTWNEIANPSAETCKIFWCRPTTVGAGHTVTATGTSFYCGLTFAAFDYAAIASPVDDTTGGAGTSTTATLTDVLERSILPTQNNELVIINGGSNSGEFAAITGGFTMFPSIPYAAGGNYSQRLAYLLQTTAAPVDPAWTLTELTDWGLAAASFKNA